MPHEDGEQARGWRASKTMAFIGRSQKRKGRASSARPLPFLVPPLSPDKGLKSPYTCLGLLLRLLRLGLLEAPWLTNAHRAIHLHRRSNSRRLFTRILLRICGTQAPRPNTYCYYRQHDQNDDEGLTIHHTNPPFTGQSV
ncbi:MAG: hypothetical protein OXFUSZZB_001125 [Candidatus Fervidibacter sp.]|jgi:hypothetical protein